MTDTPATRLVPISNHAAALLCHAANQPWRCSGLPAGRPAMDLLSRSRPLAGWLATFSCRCWSRNVALNDRPATHSRLNTNRYDPLQQRHNSASIHFTGRSWIFLELGQKVIWNLVRAGSTAVETALHCKLYFWRHFVGYQETGRSFGTVTRRYFLESRLFDFPKRPDRP